MSAGARDRARSFEAQAEVLKLARLLQREPGSLEYLTRLSLTDLRRLREQVTDALFDANRRTLTRLAAASKLLPAGVTAVIAQRAFGPLLAARISGLLEPERAVEVAAKLPPAFLADVAVELDPRRTTDVIARIPPAQIKAVGAELVSRQEYVTMGRFVGHLAEQAIRASLEVIDDEQLLRLGFVLEQKDRLESVVAVLGEQRLYGLIDAAAAHDLWVEALDLLIHLGKQRQRRLIEVAIERGEPALSSLVQAAERYELWDAVLELQSLTSEADQERFAQHLEEHHPELVAKVERPTPRGVGPRARGSWPAPPAPGARDAAPPRRRCRAAARPRARAWGRRRRSRSAA